MERKQRVIVYVDGFNFYYGLKSKRQDTFFQSNKLNPKFTLHFGKYLPKDFTCKFCHKTNHSFEEKERDVRIAISILANIYQWS